MNNNEMQKKQYKELVTEFNKATDYLGYGKIDLDLETLRSTIAELKLKKDIAYDEIKDKVIYFFLLDFYQIFLDQLIPLIKRIAKINNSSDTLQPKLLKETKNVNEVYKLLLQHCLTKYGLTINELLKSNDETVRQIAHSKTIFPYEVLPKYPNKMSKNHLPVFDYDLASWTQKEKQITERISQIKQYLLEKLGEDYSDVFECFETSRMYETLKKLSPVYENLSKTTDGIVLMGTWNLEMFTDEIKQKQ